jgi:hypothetical protein
MTTEREWRRRMVTLAFVLMPSGVLLMILGAVWANQGSPSGGYLLGSLGVLAIAFGALFVKFAIAGPVPASVRREGA